MRHYTLFTMACIGVSTWAQPGKTPVVTGQYNNARTGSTLNEITLTTAQVNSTEFGKLYSFSVDGAVFAQPLYVPNLQIGNKTVDVVYVATMHNSIYAFNANQGGQPPLWTVNLAPSVPGGIAAPCPRQAELGVLSTPVIDLSTGTLYAVGATPVSDGYEHRLYALDILTGQPKFGSPVSIAAQVAGTGVDAQGGIVTMNHTRHIQRPALLLANGNIYAGFGSCGPDPPPFHGWIVGYSASNVQSQTAIFNTTPNGEEAGIWQSGRGLVGDDQGSIYFMSGNGTFDGQYDFGSTFHKINASGALVDWFTPGNWSDLNNYDLDLAASGPILLPNANVLVGGGKEGVVYVLNPNALGQQGAPQQSFPATALCSPLTANGCQQIHGIAYWESTSNPLLYVWGSGDTLRAYRWTGAQFNTVPDSTNPLVASKPGGVMAVSSNGDNSGTGILWAITRTPDVLHAFGATDVSQELWNSSQNAARDALGTASKFVIPTIANGKVYVAAASQVVVYGLLDTQAPTSPANLAATAVTTSSVTLGWTASTDNVSVQSYQVFRDGNQVGTATSTTFTDAGLNPSTSYTYTVTATDAAGNVSTPSNSVIATTQAPPDTQPPTPPTNLGATAVTTNSVTLGWTASTDNVGVQSYQIFRNGSPVGTATSTSFTDTGLTSSTSYTYTVTATDAAGNVSTPSNSVTGITQAVQTWSISRTSLTVGSAAGNSAIVLEVTPSNAAWTAQSNASWLHLAAGSTSGTGSTLIQFSYDANPNAATQSGTLTIAGQTLTVTQAGTSMVAVNYLTTLVSSGLSQPFGLSVDVQGNVYAANRGDGTIKEWKAASQQMTTLVSSGLNQPGGLAVDGLGNVYVADTGNGAIKEWNAANQQVTTLVSTGLNQPNGVAVDGLGNVYIADTGNGAIKEWNAASQQVTTLVSTGLNQPGGVTVDGLGNVYIADTGNNAIKEWNAVSQQVTALVSTGLNQPGGVTADGQGNVYFADTGNSAIKEWSAASQQVTTPVSSGLNGPQGVAVDGQGNVYVADSGNSALDEVIFAYLGPMNKSESASAVSDSVQVLPATTPFTATSDQTWLSITGTTGGIINFSVQSNSSAASRTAHISVLGQQIAITQSGAVPASVVKSGGDGQSAVTGQTFATLLQVTVTDSNNNPIPGASVTFTVMAGSSGAGGSFSASPPMPVTADQNGVATAPALTANTIAGQFTVTASVNGLSAVFTLTNTAVAPNKLVISQQPKNGTAGSRMSAVIVKVEDANGNVLTTSTAPVTVVANGPGPFTSASTTTVSAARGVATFSNLVLNLAGNYTLSASSNGLTGATSASFTISAAVAKKLIITQQPANGTVGSPLNTVIVQVRDAYGNLSTTSTAPVTMVAHGPGSFTSGSTTVINAAGGVATFSNLLLNKAGSYTLTATSSGLSSATSVSFTITTGAATQLAIAQQPANAIAGARLSSVTVRVLDASGNLVTSSTASVTVVANGPGPFTSTSATTVSAVSGVATFSNLILNTAGTYTLSATSTGLTGATSASFTISAATAKKLVITQQPANGRAGLPLSAVIVQVQDTYGNVATTSTAPVTVVAHGPSSFTSGSTTVVNAAGGVATFSNLTLSKAGSYTLSATSSGLAGATSVSFTISP